MGILSAVGSFIGLVVGISGIIEKNIMLSLFGFGIFVVGIFIFIYIKKSKNSFKERCDKDIIELIKNPSKENKIKINQLKILKALR